MLSNTTLSLTLVAATLFLAALFLVAGAAKIFAMDRWRSSLQEFASPLLWRPSFYWLVPITELWIGTTLLVPKWTTFASAMAALALAVFTAVLLPSVLRGKAPECFCFGLASAARVGWWTIIRNCAFAILALCVHFTSSTGISASLWKVSDSESTASTALFFLIVSVGVISGLTMLAIVVRGIGFHRVGRRTAGVTRSMQADRVAVDSGSVGLPIGTYVPELKTLACSDGIGDLESFARQKGEVMVIFTSPNCRVCSALLTELAQMTSSRRRCMAVVSIGTGSRSQYGNVKGVDVICEGTRDVMRALNLSAVPSGMVFSADSCVASRAALGPDEVRSLALAESQT